MRTPTLPDLQSRGDGPLLERLALDAILPGIDGFLFLLDTEGHILDFRTGQVGELFIPAAAFLGRSLAEVLTPVAAAALMNGLAATTAGAAEVVEYTLPHAEGERSFEATLTRLSGHLVLATVAHVTRRARAERTVSELDARLRQAIRASGIGTFDHHHATNVITWSPEQRAHYGWDPVEPVTLEKFLAQVHPEDRERITAAVRRSHHPDGRGLLDVEHRIVRRDGEVRWILTRAMTEFDGEGAERRPVRTVGAVTDVTLVREARTAQLEAEAAVAASLSAIAMADLEGRIVQVNPAFLSLWGYGHVDEVLGRSSVEFWMERAGATRLLELLSTTDRVTGELVARRRDGSTFPALVVAAVIRDEAGAPLRLVGSFVDITDRVEAEARAVQDQERFRALIEQGLDLVMTFDAAGRFTYASPSVYTVLGYHAEELAGTSLATLFHPEEVADQMATFGAVLAGTRESARGTARLRHRNGSWRYVDGIVRNLLGNPAVGAIVANARDITERRHMEQRLMEADRLESIGRLAGGIAHDFNNILTAVLGYVELMQADASRGQRVRREDLDEVQQAARRAKELTAQLLAFARRQVITPQVVQLNEVVEDARKMLGRLLGEDLELGLALAPDLWRVHVDPVQVDQVLLNLAINARDAMASGGKLTIETANVVLTTDYAASHGDVEPGAYVMLVVSDTGSGIATADLPHIFEPFFTTKSVGDGTGLGLATVYGIVRQNGGHIWVYSERGVGTTFKVYFPRAQADDATGSQAVTRGSEEHLGTETILVVEDDATVRGLTVRALREAGYEVLVAPSPREALALVATHTGPLHLLLTDVVMPHLSGRQLADQLLAVRPGLLVLFVSGYTENTIVHHGVLEPGVHFLAKPFTPSELRRKVRALLDANLA